MIWATVSEHRYPYSRPTPTVAGTLGLRSAQQTWLSSVTVGGITNRKREEMTNVNYPPNSNDQLRRQLTLTWLLMGLIVVVFVWPTVKWWLGFGVSGTPRAITPRGELANYEKTTIELFQTVSPSVMFVNVSSQVFSPFSRQALEVEAGTGSGFVWDDAGHIVTNYHVIQNASSANVVMFDQSVFEASLVGQSPDHDLAVLKINAPAAQIRPVAIGSSADLAVGQAVFAIGNPFGLSHTLTTGVVSAKSRTIRGPKSQIEEVIQVDAAINPGNSGGPLLDSAGRLIGVTTAIYSPSGASAGVGFAVPVDTVNRVVPQIIAKGRYEPPRLGIRVNQELSDVVTRRLGLSGVLISGVQPNSGAAAAGLRGTEIGRSDVTVLGDIIQEINGREVDGMDALLRALDTYSRGDSITIKFLRDGEVGSASVTLE